MKKIKGLTAVELVITMAAIATLVAIGLPKMQGISSGNRMSSTINALVADLSLARSEAVNRKAAVNVNPAGGGWVNGWTVAAGATQIRLAGGIPNNMTLVLAGGGGFPPSYGSDGLLTTAGAPLTFTLCEPAKMPKIITIAQSGRHTLSTGAVACP